MNGATSHKGIYNLELLKRIIENNSRNHLQPKDCLMVRAKERERKEEKD